MISAGRLRHFIVTFLLTAVASSSIHAQISGIHSENSTDKKHGSEAIIRANVRSANYTGKTQGEIYIDDTWKVAEVTLNESGGVIHHVPVRLDVHNNLLEIQNKGKVKTLSSSNFRSITLEKEHTTYISDAVMKKTAPRGFYRLIYNKNSSVLCHYYTEIRQSNYNRALDMGEREDAVVMMKDYYFLFKGELIKLEGRRKSLARQFDENDRIYDYILSEKINPKNEFDLVKLASFCDKLNGTS